MQPKSVQAEELVALHPLHPEAPQADELEELRAELDHQKKAMADAEQQAKANLEAERARFERLVQQADRKAAEASARADALEAQLEAPPTPTIEVEARLQAGEARGAAELFSPPVEVEARLQDGGARGAELAEELAEAEGTIVALEEAARIRSEVATATAAASAAELAEARSAIDTLTQKLEAAEALEAAAVGALEVAQASARESRAEVAAMGSRLAEREAALDVAVEELLKVMSAEEVRTLLRGASSAVATPALTHAPAPSGSLPTAATRPRGASGAKRAALSESTNQPAGVVVAHKVKDDVPLAEKIAEFAIDTARRDSAVTNPALGLNYFFEYVADWRDALSDVAGAADAPSEPAITSYISNYVAEWRDALSEPAGAGGGAGDGRGSKGRGRPIPAMEAEARTV